MTIYQRIYNLKHKISAQFWILSCLNYAFLSNVNCLRGEISFWQIFDNDQKAAINLSKIKLLHRNIIKFLLLLELLTMTLENYYNNLAVIIKILELERNSSHFFFTYICAYCKITLQEEFKNLTHYIFNLLNCYAICYICKCFKFFSNFKYEYILMS